MKNTNTPKGKSAKAAGLIVSLAMAACVFAHCVGLAAAQQAKATRSAQVSARDLMIDLDTDAWEFTGNCKLTVSFGHKAEMTAPRMTVQFSEKMDEIVKLIAYGVVNFHVVTKPNADGVRRDISASAQKQAVYSEPTQTVELTGGARADIATVGGKGEAAHITGDKITADLKASKIFVVNPNMKIETPLED